MDLAQQIQVELDNIIRQLRPASLQDEGLVTALARLTAQWTEQTDIPVAMTVSGERALPIATEVALYRLTQEALNNVAKHSQADHVRLCLKKTNGRIELLIKDNGQGFNYGKAVYHKDSMKGFGLASMRAGDPWHLTNGVARKVLAHTFAVSLNLQLRRQPL